MSKQFGTVKWFDNKKGYSFIVNEDGEEVMFHYRSILMEGYKRLSEGQEVTFLKTLLKKAGKQLRLS